LLKANGFESVRVLAGGMTAWNEAGLPLPGKEPKSFLPMRGHEITADMKVSEVVTKHPETIDVFLGKGCPDMRKGPVKLMARMMSVKGAARMHRIPIDQLIRDLNAAIK